VILECTGSDGIFDPMIELVARHGSILIYSFMPHSQTISIKDLQQKEPSVFLATSCADCIPRAIELVAAGRVDLDSMVTHRFKLDQAEEAYRVARDQKDTCLKAIVEVK
jgi:L-iditol 2-dehydrogenase